MRHWLCFAVAALCFAVALPAQRRVDPRDSYYRVIAVVPLVAGASGTPAWPKHVPTAQPSGPSAPGIIAFACERSDDGKHAIVELVGLNRAALADVLADHASGVLVFEKSKVPRQDIEAAIQPFRKGFSLSRFGVAVQ
jgi:hypothetical protein